MTGAYLRTKRDGKFEVVEIEHLTKEERREQLENRSAEELMRWLDVVCESLAEAEKVLKQEGIIESES